MTAYLRQAIYADNDRLSGRHQLIPMLEHLETGPFPKLSYIQRTSMKDVAVRSYLDLPVLKFLDKKKYAIAFIGEDSSETAIITQMPDETVVSNYYYNDLPNDSLIAFFKASVIRCSPYYGVISLEPESHNFLKSIPDAKDRTFRSPALLWLQYYAGAELERQGGIDAIEQNPLIKTERFHEGIIVQVGDSPFDIQTIPGRALLVKATEAMPPVKSYS